MMLYVYGGKFESIDKDNLRMILGHAGVEPHRIRFVDLSCEDVDIEGRNCVLTIGSSFRPVSRAIVAAGLYKYADLLGDVIDRDNKFFLFNLPMEVAQMMSNDEDKQFAWDKISNMATGFNTWYPFDDPIPDMTNNKVVNVEPPAPVEEEPKKEVKTEVASEPTPVVSTPAKAVSAPVSSELGDIDIDVKECLNALFEHVNLTDQGLGKSLSKYEKFTLHTPSGELHVYPTNRIPESDQGFKVTFKDLVSILRAGIQLNAGTVTLEDKNGSEVDS